MFQLSSAPLDDSRFCWGITVNDFGIFERIDLVELSIGVRPMPLFDLFNDSAHCHIVVGVVVTWLVVLNSASKAETLFCTLLAAAAAADAATLVIGSDDTLVIVIGWGTSWIDGADVIETIFDWDSADVIDSGSLAVFDAKTVAVTLLWPDIAVDTLNLGVLLAFVFSSDDWCLLRDLSSESLVMLLSFDIDFMDALSGISEFCCRILSGIWTFFAAAASGVALPDKLANDVDDNDNADDESGSGGGGEPTVDSKPDVIVDADSGVNDDDDDDFFDDELLVDAFDADCGGGDEVFDFDICSWNRSRRMMHMRL